MTVRRWNGEAALLAGGVLLVTALVLASIGLVPDAPGRMALPSAGELVELETYLDPAELELPERAGLTETVIIEGNPFSGGVAGGARSGEEWSERWTGDTGAGGFPGSGPNASGATTTRGSSWTLSAVLVTGDRRTAILNDQLVRPGDRLEDGTRVEVIETNHILIVTPDGERRRLELERQEP